MVYNYIKWFYRVLHPYMTPDAKGDSYRSYHLEILEKEQARLDHDVDVLPICYCIVAIERHTIVMASLGKTLLKMATIQVILI